MTILSGAAAAPSALERGLGAGLRLDRRTRMMYDDRHVFINGESSTRPVATRA